MSRLRTLALPQRVVLVVAIGLCLLCAWSWWYVGKYAESVQTAADFLGTQTDAPQVDTYFVVSSGGWEHFAVPLGLVVLWTGVSVWLLGAPPETSQKGV